jgi:tagatose 1,6-diphosphate aldolase
MQRTSRDKLHNLKSLSNENGIIAALAVDQRGSLRSSIAASLGDRDATDSDMVTFKQLVVQTLSPLTSAVLLDPVYGLGAMHERPETTGLILAYEASGYDNTKANRMPSLLPEWNVGRLARAGANGVKLLLYYNPEAPGNDEKHVLVERVGAECASLGLPFFLEPVTYMDGIDRLELAKRKPSLVKKTMQEFGTSSYQVDVLKVEFPFLAAYTEGLGATTEIAYDITDAQGHALDAGNKVEQPFIYLSAGIDMSVFLASVELVGKAHVPFSGVLCGRATWKEGIPHFTSGGVSRLTKWLIDEGVKNVAGLNEVLGRCATPWWNRPYASDAPT